MDAKVDPGRYDYFKNLLQKGNSGKRKEVQNLLTAQRRGFKLYS